MVQASQPDTDSSTRWHVTVWTPAGGSLGEVAGIMDEAGKQQAVILSGADGLQPEDIERAHLIVRVVNAHEVLVKALDTAVGKCQVTLGIAWKPEDWAIIAEALHLITGTKPTVAIEGAQS